MTQTHASPPPTRNKRRVRLTVVLALFVVAGTIGSATRTPGRASAATQEAQPILFTDTVGRTPTLHSVNPDGSGRAQLPSSQTAPAFQGDWSPDRSKVAYTSLVEQVYRLHVLDLGTGNDQVITTGPEDFEPDWSPDGSRILFTSYFNRDALDQMSFITTVAPDGTDAQPVVRLVNPSYFIGNPRWSPDGGRIAFTLGSARDGGELYAMNTDGTGIGVLLEHSGWDDIDPAWSPDGRHIAFASGRYRGATATTGHSIWLLDVALGLAGTIIVDEDLDLRRPAWSPDGMWLAFDAFPLSGGTLGAPNQLHVAPSTGGPVGTLITTGSEADWGTGQLAPTTTPIAPPTPIATYTPPAVTPTAVESPTVPPPPITEVPTLPPFPTIATPGPTSTGLAPTFPPPTATSSASPVPSSTAATPTPTATGAVTGTSVASGTPTSANPTEPASAATIYLPAAMRAYRSEDR